MTSREIGPTQVSQQYLTTRFLAVFTEMCRERKPCAMTAFWLYIWIYDLARLHKPQTISRKGRTVEDVRVIARVQQTRQGMFPSENESVWNGDSTTWFLKERRKSQQVVKTVNHPVVKHLSLPSSLIFWPLNFGQRIIWSSLLICAWIVVGGDHCLLYASFLVLTRELMEFWRIIWFAPLLHSDSGMVRGFLSVGPLRLYFLIDWSCLRWFSRSLFSSNGRSCQ